MKNFQQKRGFKNIIHSRPVLIFLGVLLLFFAWGVIGFMNKMYVTMENKEIAQKKVATLEAEKEKLSSSIARLKTQEGVEESIRDKFGLAKDGEGLIVVVEDKSGAVKKESSFSGFFSFFKNWFK